MKLLDMTTVAKRLGCSKGHVSKLINGKVKGARILACVRLGRKMGVIEATLEEYIKSSESEGWSEWTENAGGKRVLSRNSRIGTDDSGGGSSGASPVKKMRPPNGSASAPK